MLQAIRDGSKGIAAKIIVGLIILTFALFGIESIVALGGGEDAPAEVNGVEISEYQVSQMVQLQKRRLQAQFGESFDMDEGRLRQMAVESLINETLLKTAASEAGIHYSDREIDKLILQSPEFQVNGAFDRDQFDLVLRSAGFTRSTYRELLRTNLSMQQMQNAFQASAFSTQAESDVTSKLENQTRDFAYTVYSFSDQLKNTQVSPEEVKQYFDENPQQFMTNEGVIVDYIELSRSNFDDKVDITDGDIEDRYSAMVEESNTKKEYRAAHILLLNNDQEARNKLAEAKSKIEAGESFEDLAKELSEDDSSKFSGGDLGFSTADVFETEFTEALLSLKKGDVSEVVETRDGLHLIKLVDERQPEVAPLAELKDSIVASLKEEGAQALYVEALEILKDEAFSSGDLETPAKALSLSVKTSKEITRLSNSGIAQYKAVVDAAFSEVVLNEDSNSEVIEVEDGKAIVVNLNTYNESKVKDFAIVKGQIETQLKNTQARDDLSELVSKAQQAAKSGETVVGTWEVRKDQTRNTQGVDSSILAKAFETAKGDFNIAQLAGGDKALIRVDGINNVDSVSNTESANQKVARGKAYNEYRAYQQFANDNAEIERN